MTPLLHDHSGAPAFPFLCHVGAHMVTGEGSRGERAPCHWCGGGRGLDMHHPRDCPDPHKRCRMLRPGRCVVLEHHSGYWAKIISGNECPYNGDYHGAMPRGDYA